MTTDIQPKPPSTPAPPAPRDCSFAVELSLGVLAFLVLIVFVRVVVGLAVNT